MSNALRSLKASTSNRQRPVRGNVVIKPASVDGFDVKANTMTGEVMNGPGKGQTITVQIPDRGEDYASAAKMVKKSNAQTSMYVDTENGGLVMAENLSPGENGTYKANYVATFNRQPSPEDAFVADQLATMRIVETQDGKKVGYIDTLDLEGAQTATSGDALRQAILDVMPVKGTMYMFMVDENGGADQEIFRIEPKTDNAGNVVRNEDESIVWESAQEAAERIAAFFDDPDVVASFKGAFEGKGVSVVPAETFRVGADTLDAALKAEAARAEGTSVRPPSVDPRSFQTASIGRRVAGFVARVDDLRSKGSKSKLIEGVPEDLGDRLAARFHETADSDARAAFEEGGWSRVSDAAMKRFMAAYGQKLESQPERGFAVTNLLTMKNEGYDRGIVIKTFGGGRAQPYPNVEALADKRVAETIELKSALLAVSEAAEATKTAEAPAAAAVEEAPDVAPDTTEPDDDLADLDDLSDLEALDAS